MSEEIVNIELMPRADLTQIWDSYRQQFLAIKETAENLQITSADQVKEIKLARSTRLALKEIRIAVEKRRKELGEGILRETQKINGAAREIKEAIEPLEARLLEQELFIDREKERLLTLRRSERLTELAPYLTGQPLADVGLMEPSVWAGFLADAKDLHDLKVKREADAEAYRLAEIERQVEERRQVEKDNRRLRAEADAREAEVAAERAAAAAAAAAAAEQIRRERLAREEADRQRIAAEDAERRRVAAELRAEAERIAIQAEAERKAASAPDKEKLLKFADCVYDLKLPYMQTTTGEAIANDIDLKRLGFIKWINEQISKL